MPYFVLTNNTHLPLNIALSHLGPVHYANHVMPGDTIFFTCGSVWFTVEVKVATETNSYQWHHTAVPIAGAVVGAGTLAAGGWVFAGAAAEAGIISSIGLMGAKLSKMAAGAGTLGSVQRLRTMKKGWNQYGKGPAKGWLDGFKGGVVLRKYRVYVPRQGLLAYVKGGPSELTSDEESGQRYLNLDGHWDPFDIVCLPGGVPKGLVEALKKDKKEPMRIETPQAKQVQAASPSTLAQDGEPKGFLEEVNSDDETSSLPDTSPYVHGSSEFSKSAPALPPRNS
ncbi:hypothetical protein BZG36_00745 [Bifiguratus adelaidae]|uniref:Uncharacterized protein n=1 Tax=Bifiguratus adelaidae TaxID=1938954 RepID=A0A261Y6S5_9FUNG|nr:hypothetical protein BZG36_00745 [Bifiguratus adelaidae]